MNTRGPVYVSVSSVGYKWLHFHACRPYTETEHGKNCTWQYPRTHTVSEGLTEQNIIDRVTEVIAEHFPGSEINYRHQIVPYYHTHEEYYTCYGEYRKCFQEIRYDVRACKKEDYFTSIVSPVDETKYRNCFVRTMKTLESFKAQEFRRAERERKMQLRYWQSIQRGREQQRKWEERRIESVRNRPIKSTPNILKMIGAANQLTAITQ